MFQILQPFLGSMIRHALTTAAGALVTYGVLRSSQVESFVSACLLFAGIAWAAWQKINTPDMLGRLSDRMKAKNIQRASVGDVFKNQGAAMVALLGGFAVFSMLATASPAGAQGLFFDGLLPGSAAKVQRRPPCTGPATYNCVRKRSRGDLRMNAGLSSLIGQVQGVVAGPSTADQLWANVEKIALADLQYAQALADAVTPPSAASKARSACYGALVALISQQSGANAAHAGQALGPVAAVTKFEQLAQLSDALQSGSPMQVACAPVAQAMRLQLGSFLLKITGGALSLGALGVGLP